MAIGSMFYQLLAFTFLFFTLPITTTSKCNKHLLPTFSKPNIYPFCVDQNGCCPFKTVQSAVDAIPSDNQNRSVISISAGVYTEKVIIPKNKPNITLKGQGYQNTIIQWNDTAKSSGGTYYSGSVQVFSANFVAQNISFKNFAPAPVPGVEGAQAVALRIGGDKAAFWGCGFYGAQDTLHDDEGRHYFKNCYVEGSIDFIFGHGKSVYEDCIIRSTSSSYGAVTANGRDSKHEDSGFAFKRCSISGTGRVYLGRAWRPYSTVVFANTYMTKVIRSGGWNDWDNTTNDKTVFYGEYNNTGPGADVPRVNYFKNLTYAEVAPFTSLAYIQADKWLEPYLSM